MNLVFFSTSDVFRAEEVLNANDCQCRIVPTPVTDKAYCGVCIEVAKDVDISVLKDMEYDIVNQGDK